MPEMWLQMVIDVAACMTDKPPYSVPSMEAIRAIRWNGYNVASTFAGCGGSSTGYRMAGFRVLWASEFVAAARASYKANKADYTLIDHRDIRQVQASEILDEIGLAVGDLDILDGSPPCSSFSTAGNRQASWGKVKSYSDRAQRTDDLFFEFVRILEGVRPKVFVAENVSGLVKGTAKGYFIEIMRALKAAGYDVVCKVLDAQWLGVPQARQRTIFVGVRSDLGLRPVHPKPLPYRYTVKDALPWISSVGGIRQTGFGGGKRTPARRPSPTVMAGGGGGMNTSQFGVEAETDMSPYAVGKEWHCLTEGGQSDKYFQLVRSHRDKPVGTITVEGMKAHAASVSHPTECRKFSIAELKRLCGFPDDFILTGTYQQQWERCGRAVPPVMMAHIATAIRDGILAHVA